MKLLLDENLSPWVAAQLRTEGVDAVHIRERGMLGATDHAVLEKAFEEERVLVTMNVADFEKLAAARELHAGIVLVTPGGLSRPEQLAILQRTIERIASEDMVNRALRAQVDGELVVEELPRSSTSGVGT